MPAVMRQAQSEPGTLGRPKLVHSSRRSRAWYGLRLSHQTKTELIGLAVALPLIGIAAEVFMWIGVVRGFVAILICCSLGISAFRKRII